MKSITYRTLQCSSGAENAFLVAAALPFVAGTAGNNEQQRAGKRQRKTATVERVGEAESACERDGREIFLGRSLYSPYPPRRG